MGLTEFLKSKDLFGVPVQLTYKGERGFTSAVGGCCSIMLVLIAMLLFVTYSLDFYQNPQFSTSETVSYIDFTNGQEAYYLPTNRTTVAVSISNVKYPHTSKYLRARFSQWDGNTDTKVKAVYCSDFFADKIAAEKEMAELYGEDSTDMFYTNAFGFSSKICPDTTSLMVQGAANTF